MSPEINGIITDLVSLNSNSLIAIQRLSEILKFSVVAQIQFEDLGLDIYVNSNTDRIEFCNLQFEDWQSKMFKISQIKEVFELLKSGKLQNIINFI